MPDHSHELVEAMVAPSSRNLSTLGIMMNMVVSPKCVRKGFSGHARTLANSYPDTARQLMVATTLGLYHHCKVNWTHAPDPVDYIESVDTHCKCDITWDIAMGEYITFLLCNVYQMLGIDSNDGRWRAYLRERQEFADVYRQRAMNGLSTNPFLPSAVCRGMRLVTRDTSLSVVALALRQVYKEHIRQCVANVYEAAFTAVDMDVHYRRLQSITVSCEADVMAAAHRVAILASECGNISVDWLRGWLTDEAVNALVLLFRALDERRPTSALSRVLNSIDIQIQRELTIVLTYIEARSQNFTIPLSSGTAAKQLCAVTSLHTGDATSAILPGTPRSSMHCIACDKEKRIASVFKVIPRRSRVTKSGQMLPGLGACAGECGARHCLNDEGHVAAATHVQAHIDGSSIRVTCNSKRKPQDIIMDGLKCTQRIYGTTRERAATMSTIHRFITGTADMIPHVIPDATKRSFGPYARTVLRRMVFGTCEERSVETFDILGRVAVHGDLSTTICTSCGHAGVVQAAQCTGDEILCPHCKVNA